MIATILAAAAVQAAHPKPYCEAWPQSCPSMEVPSIGKIRVLIYGEALICKILNGDGDLSELLVPLRPGFAKAPDAFMTEKGTLVCPRDGSKPYWVKP